MLYLSKQDQERLMMRPTECLDEGLSIQDKIRQAQILYGLWGDALKKEAQINNLLEDLERGVTNSRECMLDFRIVEICKRCDEEEGGSCCGAGMENKFDTFLLLINLLLGVTLPEHHLRPDSCYLLNDRGCILKVRLVLCVDFLCEKIHKELSRDELVRLQNISGEELLTGFKLYDAIKKFIRQVARQV